MKEMIRRTAMVRFEPHVQRIKKLLKDDVMSEKFQNYMMEVYPKAKRIIDNCPHWRRYIKSTDRWLREALKVLKVTDFPEGERQKMVVDIAWYFQF